MERTGCLQSWSSGSPSQMSSPSWEHRHPCSRAGRPRSAREFGRSRTRPRFLGLGPKDPFPISVVTPTVFGSHTRVLSIEVLVQRGELFGLQRDLPSHNQHSRKIGSRFVISTAYFRHRQHGVSSYWRAAGTSRVWRSWETFDRTRRVWTGPCTRFRAKRALATWRKPPHVVGSLTGDSVIPSGVSRRR